jgi:hypothetical protein
MLDNAIQAYEWTGRAHEQNYQGRDCQKILYDLSYDELKNHL